jgi:hypothetical protein
MSGLRKTGLAKQAKMDKHIYDIPMRVLIYKEDDEFVAHALEMDLVGYGVTQNKAIEDLMTMVFCQLSFAHQKQDAGLLMFSAPQEYLDRWEAARKTALQNEVIEDKSINLKYRAICLTIPKSEIKSALSKRRDFKPVSEVCA